MSSRRQERKLTLPAPLPRSPWLCSASRGGPMGPPLHGFGRGFFGGELFEDRTQDAENLFGGSWLQNEFQHPVWRELRSFLGGDEARQLLRIDGCILPELEGDCVALAFDRIHTDSNTQQFQRSVIEQVAHGLRRLTIAV